jgi:hypothetical protein
LPSRRRRIAVAPSIAVAVASPSRRPSCGIRGRPQVGGSSGKDRHPWLAGEVPYSLREVSSADDSGRFAIVAAVLGGLWWFYLRREWQARVFGNAVTCASEHPVRLRCQNRELVHVNGNNNIMGVDLGRGGVVWFRQFLGRGRNGMWLSHLVPRFLYTWNQNSSFFSRGKILECSPYQEATAEPPANRQEAMAQPPPIVPEPPQIGEPSPKGTMPTLVPLPASGITPAENRRYPNNVIGAHISRLRS